jgi:hypothetical protein
LRLIKTGGKGFMTTSYKEFVLTSIDFRAGYFNGRWSIANIQMGPKPGEHPKNTGLRESGVHEFGHVIQVYMSKQKASGGWFDYMEDGRYSKSVISKALRIVRKNVAYKSLSDEQIIDEISDYAGLSSNECMSEALSDYMRNRGEASLLSKAIWEILKREVI